jgi:hypothetical protein
LLALTEEDIEDYGLYPLLAMSAGLSSHKDARELAVNNFERIAHPSIQVNWAIMLMRDPKIQPIIVRHMKKAIDAPKGAKTLAATRDPRFEGLKDEVEAILEKTRRVSVESAAGSQLRKRHRLYLDDWRQWRPRDRRLQGGGGDIPGCPHQAVSYGGRSSSTTVPEAGCWFVAGRCIESATTPS